MIKRLSRKVNDKGYTLVELIVVISIMAIMVGLLSLGITVLFSKDAEAVARTIDDELSEVRMLSMSKDGKFEMILHIDASNPADNNIVIKKDDVPYKTVALKKSASLTVSYGLETKSSGDIAFEFDKGNGSVKSIGGTPFATGVCTITATASRLSSKTAMVDLVAATGRHYVRK